MGKGSAAGGFAGEPYKPIQENGDVVMRGKGYIVRDSQ